MPSIFAAIYQWSSGRITDTSPTEHYTLWTVRWKDYTIGTLHYNWPMSVHASQAFITSSHSSVPIV